MTAPDARGWRSDRVLLLSYTVLLLAFAVGLLHVRREMILSVAEERGVFGLEFAKVVSAWYGLTALLCIATVAVRVLRHRVAHRLTAIATSVALFILPVGMLLFLWWVLFVRPAEQVRLDFDEELEQILARTEAANRERSTDAEEVDT